jgi:hypothetical protein
MKCDNDECPRKATCWWYQLHFLLDGRSAHYEPDEDGNCIHYIPIYKDCGEEKSSPE